MNDDDKIDSIKKWLGTGSINIFGLPFSGKDTHGHELAKSLGGKLLGGGQILRGSVIPPRIREIMETGELIPTEDYIDIVLPYLSSPELDNSPLILSSVGRWAGEEEGVLEATKKSGHPTKAVLHLEIDPLEARSRWYTANHVRSRADDAEHLLEVRFSEFVTKTLPVIQSYKELGLLIEVDGRPSIDIVNTNIVAELFKLSKQ